MELLEELRDKSFDAAKVRNMFLCVTLVTLWVYCSAALGCTQALCRAVDCCTDIAIVKQLNCNQDVFA
jgi:hypothetical protein